MILRGESKGSPNKFFLGESMKRATLVTLVLLASCVGLMAQDKPDAEMLELQYKTCAQHYIPADKCTLEVWKQLHDKDKPSDDPLVKQALRAVHMLQRSLANPDIKLTMVYAATDSTTCISYSGHNAYGGMVSDSVNYKLKVDKHHPERPAVLQETSDDCMHGVGQVMGKHDYHLEQKPGRVVLDEVMKALKWERQHDEN